LRLSENGFIKRRMTEAASVPASDCSKMRGNFLIHGTYEFELRPSRPLVGTFETCQRAPRMSALRDTSEVPFRCCQAVVDRKQTFCLGKQTSRGRVSPWDRRPLRERSVTSGVAPVKFLLKFQKLFQRAEENHRAMPPSRVVVSYDHIEATRKHDVRTGRN